MSMSSRVRHQRPKSNANHRSVSVKTVRIRLSRTQRSNGDDVHASHFPHEGRSVFAVPIPEAYLLRRIFEKSFDPLRFRRSQFFVHSTCLMRHEPRAIHWENRYGGHGFHLNRKRTFG